MRDRRSEGDGDGGGAAGPAVGTPGKSARTDAFVGPGMFGAGNAQTAPGQPQAKPLDLRIHREPEVLSQPIVDFQVALGTGDLTQALLAIHAASRAQKQEYIASSSIGSEQKVSWYSLASPHEWFAEQYAHYYRLGKSGDGLEAGTKAKLDELDTKTPPANPAPAPGGAGPGADAHTESDQDRQRLPFPW